jgi:inosine-uridine nucleoside N-ribohydrolase
MSEPGAAVRPIIIDTDPGIDDAMAIFFALAHPALEVLGLTTIFGNVTTELATVNALRLLEIADRADLPVAPGATDPLCGPYSGPVTFVHGDDGQGNVHLPPAACDPIDTSAAEFIVEQVMRAPGEITLVPIGPLTNLALALRLEPQIAAHVREVVLMGGNALGPGNATPAAEANIRNDPEAADVVFGAGWPVTMVGLDVTHRVHMRPEHLANYGASDHPAAQHIAAILPFYTSFYRARVGIEGIYVHDSSAIAYVIAPELFTTQRWPVRVDTTHGISRGKTWPALGDTDEHRLAAWHDRPLVNVCTDVDADAVIALELATLHGGER